MPRKSRKEADIPRCKEVRPTGKPCGALVVSFFEKGKKRKEVCNEHGRALSQRGWRVVGGHV